MTAEIAILNRTAVALAADSAVTIGREKVWKNANKLFSLSSYNDIGVMIFSTGDFCGVAWEIVLKQFRKNLSNTVFGKLEDGTAAFIDFLDKFEVPANGMGELNLYVIFVNSIRECNSCATDKGAINRRKQYISKIESLIKEAEELPIIIDGISRDAFLRTHSKMIRDFLNSEAGVYITSAVHSKMITLCWERARRAFSSSFETGVVFAGYGENEILPAIQHWVVDGKYGAKARAWLQQEHNLNSAKAAPAYVIPFAQSDIAYLFMEGMQLEYLEFIDQTMNGILDEKSSRLIESYVNDDEKLVEMAKQARDNEILSRRFFEEFKKMRKETAISPMLSVISSLPKEEMAAMAEALVEITSLRRKIDSRIESVGGPVDVAIISKSDGFIWIKRKHYFSMDLNHDFMVRRGRRFGGGGNERGDE